MPGAAQDLAFIAVDVDLHEPRGDAVVGTEAVERRHREIHLPEPAPRIAFEKELEAAPYRLAVLLLARLALEHLHARCPHARRADVRVGEAAEARVHTIRPAELLHALHGG